VITAEVFNRKETEYKNEVANLTATLSECDRNQRADLHEGMQILELANRLHPSYMDMGYEKRVKLLKLLASNYLLNGTTISATYRSPFVLFEELASCPSKLPRLDVVRTFQFLISYFLRVGQRSV